MDGFRGLWEARPQWLENSIDTAFRAVSDPGFDGYAIIASEDYAFGDVAGTDLVAMCISECEAASPATSFRMLDVGAGEGRFIANVRSLNQGAWKSKARLSAVGVSARVYHSPCANAAMETRTVNVENVLSTSPFQNELKSGELYSCILSSETFRHLRDPLGTLCQLFLLLEVDGVLAIDRLHLEGLGSAQRLMDWWQEAGYEVEGDVSGERIAPLFLRRMHAAETLFIPVTYQEARPHETSSSSPPCALYKYIDSGVGMQIAKRIHGSCSLRGRSRPAWTRARLEGQAVVPQPQWRQMEMMLKRLVAKC